MRSTILLMICMTVIMGVFGCATTHELPPPQSLHIPARHMDNSGDFLCPYTQDHVLAEWVDMQIKAGAYESIAKGLGSTAAAAFSATPLSLASFVFRKVAEGIARSAAIRSAGGMDNIRAKSDVSFDRIDDLAVYMYQFYSAEETYPYALAAARLLYPELEQRYIPAIEEARK